MWIPTQPITLLLSGWSTWRIKKSVDRMKTQSTLVEGIREAGAYTVRWDGRDAQGHELASGVYLYRLRTDQGRVETRKLVLLR
jgi:hypothetical protein